MQDETVDVTRRAIRSARQALGWTQVTLAQKAKMDQSKISLYERGQIELTPEELARVEDAVSSAKIPRRFAHEFQRKFRRQQAGMSQQELANKAQISRSKLSRWESGLLELTAVELARVEGALIGKPALVGNLAYLRHAGPIVRPDPDLQVRNLEEQIRILKKLVDAQRELISLFPEVLGEKDAKIVELEKKIADLRELYDVGTQAVVATARYEELREKILAEKPTATKG